VGGFRRGGGGGPSIPTPPPSGRNNRGTPSCMVEGLLQNRRQIFFARRRDTAPEGACWSIQTQWRHTHSAANLARQAYQSLNITSATVCDSHVLGGGWRRGCSNRYPDDASQHERLCRLQFLRHFLCGFCGRSTEIWVKTWQCFNRNDWAASITSAEWSGGETSNTCMQTEILLDMLLSSSNFQNKEVARDSCKILGEIHFPGRGTRGGGPR